MTNKTICRQDEVPNQRKNDPFPYSQVSKCHFNSFLKWQSPSKKKKKKKFVGEDGVYVEGLEESLGTVIGNSAGDKGDGKTKKEIYFKTCGMNAIINLSDDLPGFQLHAFSGIMKDRINEKLDVNKQTYKNLMENETFAQIVKKASKPEEVLYECLQELDELKCTQEAYGSKSVYRHILYNVCFPMMINKFSEADSIINIWVPLLQFTFCKTLLWSHCWGTVPCHIKSNSPVYIKLDFRLVDKITCNEDWAAEDAGKSVADWKYYTDKTKLILTTKSQINEIIKKYHINKKTISKLKIPFIHILSINAVICFMELHENGLYKIVQASSFEYPMTRNTLGSDKTRYLIEGLSALKVLVLDLFEFICDLKKEDDINGKKPMGRIAAQNSGTEREDASIDTWVRELWFPPNFLEENKQ